LIGHDISTLEIDHAFPLLLFAGVTIAVMVWVYVDHIIKKLCYSTSQQEELLGVEDLLNFYESLY